MRGRKTNYICERKDVYCVSPSFIDRVSTSSPLCFADQDQLQRNYNIQYSPQEMDRSTQDSRSSSTHHGARVCVRCTLSNGDTSARSRNTSPLHGRRAQPLLEFKVRKGADPPAPMWGAGLAIRYNDIFFERELGEGRYAKVYKANVYGALRSMRMNAARSI